MEGGQPQCVLSVDVSTCGRDALAGRWGRGGGEAGSWRGCSRAWTGVRRRSWDPGRAAGPSRGPSRATPSGARSPDISSNWRMGTSPT